MTTPYFEYYISVCDKRGLFKGYGKKMSQDTFTMDGVNMIQDNDPNYQIQEIALSEDVLSKAGFYRLGISQYKIPANPNDIFYHIPVVGNKVVEVLFRAGSYYYVKPNHPSPVLKSISTISALQTEAYNECSDIKLPLLETIINCQKLYSYLASRTSGLYVIETKMVVAGRIVSLSSSNFNYLLLEPDAASSLPVIEIRIINPKSASFDIHTIGTVHGMSYNSWTDVVHANPGIQAMPPQQADQIKAAYQLVIEAVKYSKEC